MQKTLKYSASEKLPSNEEIQKHLRSSHARIQAIDSLEKKVLAQVELKSKYTSDPESLATIEKNISGLNKLIIAILMTEFLGKVGQFVWKKMKQDELSAGIAQIKMSTATRFHQLIDRYLEKLGIAVLKSGPLFKPTMQEISDFTNSFDNRLAEIRRLHSKAKQCILLCEQTPKDIQTTVKLIEADQALSAKMEFELYSKVGWWILNTTPQDCLDARIRILGASSQGACSEIIDLYVKKADRVISIHMPPELIDGPTGCFTKMIEKYTTKTKHNSPDRVSESKVHLMTREEIFKNGRSVNHFVFTSATFLNSICTASKSERKQFLLEFQTAAKEDPDHYGNEVELLIQRLKVLGLL